MKMDAETSSLRSDLIVSNNRANKLLHLFLETDHKAHKLKLKIEKTIIERNSLAIVAIALGLLHIVSVINFYWGNL